MTDAPERHNSTRWAKAAVPSYGDEWDDGYEFDEDEEENLNVHEPLGYEEQETIQEDHVENAPGGKHQVEGGYEEVHGHVDNQLKVTQSPDLVLSIDRFKGRQDTDSSSEEEEEEQVPETDPIHEGETYDDEEDAGNDSFMDVYATSEVEEEKERDVVNQNEEDVITVPQVEKPLETQFKNRTAKNIPAKISIPADDTRSFDIEPPTPTFGGNEYRVPETPYSDMSFTSDGDSIQNEPANLNLVDVKERENSSPSEPFLRDVEKDESHDKHDIIEKPDQNEFVNHDPKSTESVDTTPTADIHTSNAPTAALETNKSISATENDDQSSAPAPLVLSIDNRDFDDDSDDDWGYNGRNSDDSDDEMDNEKDIEDDHYANNSTSALDTMINDLQGAFVDDAGPEEISDKPVHQKINDKDLQLDTSSSKYSSVNPTPVSPLDFGLPSPTMQRDHESYMSGMSSRKPSVRKPPTNDNFASNVRGSKETLPLRSKESLIKPKLELFPVDSTASSSSLGGYPHDTNSEKQLPLALPPTPKDTHSFQPPSAFSAGSDDAASRRISTMTTNTFSMGNWQPNTNSFRDQFINDNDNESTIGDNPDRNETGRSSEDDRNSFDSSLSIPDTVDAAMPSISEDPDDTTEYEHSHILAGTSTNESTPKPLPKAGSNTGGDRQYSSMLDVLENTSSTPPQSRKVSVASVSTQIADTSKDEHPSPSSLDNHSKERKASGGSIGPTTSSLSKPPQLAVGGAYPPYSWAKIMGTSQGQDRIRMLRDAKEMESNYDTGLQNWLEQTLKQSENAPTIHIGKIASAVYQNAPHSDIRRHNTLLSKVSIVKDKVETSGTSIGKRLFGRGKKK
ncbi:hypothetical protein CAAN1_18S00606 [[Candida] anglica]|uniref:Protein FYV8 n=1 Tax=[Candida] anglica TaxID=148631 RepID=A0ABP0EPF1_9ASCO